MRFLKFIFTKKLIRNLVLVIGGLFTVSKVTDIDSLDDIANAVAKRFNIESKELIFAFGALCISFVGARKFRKKFE